MRSLPKWPLPFGHAGFVLFDKDCIWDHFGCFGPCTKNQRWLPVYHCEDSQVVEEKILRNSIFMTTWAKEPLKMSSVWSMKNESSVWSMKNDWEENSVSKNSVSDLLGKLLFNATLLCGKKTSLARANSMACQVLSVLFFPVNFRDIGNSFSVFTRTVTLCWWLSNAKHCALSEANRWLFCHREIHSHISLHFTFAPCPLFVPR